MPPVGLNRYRSFDRYPYPFARLLGVGLGVTATYLVVRVFVLPVSSMPIQLLAAGLATLVWCVVLLRPVMNPLLEIVAGTLGGRLGAALRKRAGENSTESSATAATSSTVEPADTTGAIA